jgi:hypothetical protein
MTTGTRPALAPAAECSARKPPRFATDPLRDPAEKAVIRDGAIRNGTIGGWQISHFIKQRYRESAHVNRRAPHIHRSSPPSILEFSSIP